MITRLLTTLAVICGSALIELLQSQLGRTASLHDLMANAAGATAALLLRLSPSYPIVMRWGMGLSAITALVVASYSPTRSLIDVWQQHQSGPELTPFDSPIELERWYIHSAEVSIIPSPFRAQSDSNSNAMQATFIPDKFPAVQLQQFLSNWSGYDRLQFDIGRADDGARGPVEVRLRIVDQQSDFSDRERFVEIYRLNPGEQQRIALPIADIIRQPVRRPMRADSIRCVEFMAVDIEEPVTFQFGNLRLVSATQEKSSTTHPPLP